MEKSTYFENAAKAIKNLGFRVFVHDNEKSRLPYFYGYFSDGVNIGYFQLGDFGGVRWSTVNAPGSFCTGFSCEDNGVNYEDLTAETLRGAFVRVPRWYRMTETDNRRGGVKKFASLEDFLNCKRFSNEANRDTLKEI